MTNEDSVTADTEAKAPGELSGPPAFEIGQKVRAKKAIRNDGTYPGREIGEVLIDTGDLGYINNIGTYLQLYYIYAVDFYDRKALVGMRAAEMEVVDAHSNRPKDDPA
ncbi:MAG: nitrogen fixation protein NifZ [Azospirillum sp.]|nr:nitrogen fixation protein NifZ [Azospirillum sp.]